MAFYVPFKLENSSGVGVTGKTSSDVKFYDLSDVEQTYTTLTEIGYGFYVASGFSAFCGQVKMKIGGVLQQSFMAPPIWDGELPGEQITSGEIPVARIPSGIPATDIADGSVSDAEFQYLNGVTSAIQTQLNNKVGKTGNETVAGIKTWSDSQIFTVDTGVSPSKYPQVSSYESPTEDEHLTPKAYVDSLIGSITGVVQSNKCIKLVEHLVNSAYSRTTIEGCVSYLTGTMGVTSKYRGLVIIEMGGNSPYSGNEIVATGSTWLANYVDITALSKVKININNSGASLTADAILRNLHLYDNSEKAAQAFTNVTFEDCIIDNVYADYTFTNCKFRNVIIKGLSAITLTNCTGFGLLTNCKVTMTGKVVNNTIDGVTADDLF
jgi:hypothetical protein